MPRNREVTPEKQLTVKIGVVRRLAKEAAYYVKETKENEAKLAKMKEEGKDFYDIKKFNEVLDESKMMIPDSEARLKKNVEELDILVKAYPDLDAEHVQLANEIVAEHS